MKVIVSGTETALQERTGGLVQAEMTVTLLVSGSKHELPEG